VQVPARSQVTGAGEDANAVDGAMSSRVQAQVPVPAQVNVRFPAPGSVRAQASEALCAPSQGGLERKRRSKQPQETNR